MASRLRAAAMGLLLAGSLAGCVSIPTGGPVRSFAVTASPGGQSQPFPHTIAQPPQDSWSPTQMVSGFITAAASLGDQEETAKEYLTPDFSKKWIPDWSATVYSSGPDIVPLSPPACSSKGKGRQQTTVTVTVKGKEQATVAKATGSYAVPSNKAPAAPLSFTLVRQACGPWRISSAPMQLLLTSQQFDNDYQPRNLYFFDDPTGRVLVPDPVYVPNQAAPAVLMKNLVTDLIRPPADWLSGATTTEFPRGTSVGPVTLTGVTATVNLNVARTGNAVWQKVFAQLYSTLTGSGQGSPPVQQVELVVNGKPWIAPGEQDPVQNQPQYSTPSSANTGVFYYLDKDGWLERQAVQQNGTAGTPDRIHVIGRGYSQIAVSEFVDGVQYLAALQPSGTLYVGPLGGELVKRGVGYTSMSWAPDGELWATSGDQIFMLNGAVRPSQPGGQPVAVNVNFNAPPYVSWLQVASDGVRVAMIASGNLYFGAITSQPAPRATHGINNQPGPHPAPMVTKIELSPSSVTAPSSAAFTAVTWYGPYNVITLAQSAPQLTEYPVNGAGSTPIPPPPSPIESVTASDGYPLIASVAKEEMMFNPSPTGAWTDIAPAATGTVIHGTSPVYPG